MSHLKLLPGAWVKDAMRDLKLLPEIESPRICWSTLLSWATMTLESQCYLSSAGIFHLASVQAQEGESLSVRVLSELSSDQPPRVNTGY